jgi:ribosome maturation factor RimP
MTESSAPDALLSVVDSVLASLGLDCYDVELAGAPGRARTLRVLVERTDRSPVDLESITAATEALSPALDGDREADRILHGAYTLEVSSPGLERPLRRPQHWRGVIGERVSVKARVDGRTERIQGVVVGVDDGSITLDVDSTQRRIDLDDVTQARTVFEWGPQQKPGRSREARRKREQQKVTP